MSNHFLGQLRHVLVRKHRAVETNVLVTHRTVSALSHAALHVSFQGGDNVLRFEPAADELQNDTKATAF